MKIDPSKHPILLPSWPNLAEKTAVYTHQPWDWDVAADAISEMSIAKLAKAKRKERMESVVTQWHVYSAFKGENWFGQISNENPPHSCAAFVADYDLPIAATFVEEACRQRASQKGHVPKYIETTLSGHLRAVWPFAVPALISNRKFADLFLLELGKLLQVEQFLPGLDRKSYSCEMRWTNGGWWREMEAATILSTEMITGLMITTAKRLNTGKADIPLEKLAPILLQRYPKFEHFHGGTLKMEQVGIRFWDEKADNPNGAMVVDKGLYCFTGEKSLKTWEDLLTKSVVDNLRTVNYGEASKDLYFDGKHYFRKTTIGFADMDRQDVLLHIASHGHDRAKKKDEIMSQAENVLKFVQDKNRVDGAAPLLFRPDGIVQYQNRRVLNISRTIPTQPSDKKKVTPADFPWLTGFFNAFFANPDKHPKEHFFAWWQRFYRGAIEHKPLNGQALFICGPKACGKNLISELILPTAMGGSAPNPYKYLMGDTSFSDDIFGSPVLAINDEDAPPEFKKGIFEQKIKALVANNEHTFHPKFMKSVRIEWDGRLIVTLNDGPKDVGLLPMLNPNTVEKIMFFLAKSHDHPFHDKYRNREIVAEELPYLLRWLLDVYEAPKSILLDDRIGVRSYHDPFLVRINRQEQTSYNLLELLAAWTSPDDWNRKVDHWSGTPTDLLRNMTQDQTLEKLLNPWDTSKLSKALGDLARSETPGVKFDGDREGRRYTLSKKGITATVRGPVSRIIDKLAELPLVPGP